MTAVLASPAMFNLLALAKKAAMLSANVLIVGESGAGKELIARALHHYSLRCAKPWVDINCAALPEHLVESELFGHEKGSFSGALASKPGLFELAHTGTLFLDEIGELDARVQVKLLRVLDGTSYYRLGGTRKVTVDVRLLTATNQDLETAVAEGRFRKDLYHRLNQLRLQVPPLRQRPEDVAVLADHFLSLHAPGKYFSEEAIDCLQRYSWPGNVRELRNAAIQAALNADADEVGTADLGSEFRIPDVEPQPVNGGQQPRLEDLERQTILSTLTRMGGNQTRAAEALGISSRTLSRKLKEYGKQQHAAETFAD